MFRSGYILLTVVFILSLNDIFRCVSAEEHGHNENLHEKDEFEAEFGDDLENGNAFSEGTEEDHIEVREQSSFVQPKSINNAQDLPPLRILYCVSCGYKQAFEQFTNFAKERYPNMLVEGGNFAPILWKAYLAQGFSVLKIAALAVIMTGSNPFAFMGMGYPGLLQHAHNNKMSSCMMVFMLGNLAEQSLISTGAFEVYLGDELIWSKIESGRVPSPQEFIQLIDTQLAVLGKSVTSESFGEFKQPVN